MVVLGLDLRASPKRPSTVVALDKYSSVTFMGSFIQDEELIQIAQSQQPKLISIGVPLGLPLGLCCSETSCSCDFAVAQRKGRLLELELSRMGISCFLPTRDPLSVA